VLETSKCALHSWSFCKYSSSTLFLQFSTVSVINDLWFLVFVASVAHLYCWYCYMWYLRHPYNNECALTFHNKLPFMLYIFAYVWHEKCESIVCSSNWDSYGWLLESFVFQDMLQPSRLETLVFVRIISEPEVILFWWYSICLPIQDSGSKHQEPRDHLLQLS
jgi:hypothetical protein